MNEQNKARERWIVIGTAAVITAILIVGGILSHEPSAEECLKKAGQLWAKDREESIRRGEYSSPKLFQAALRRSERWFRKAIDKGHPDAHEALGIRLLIADRIEETLQVLLDGANKGFHGAMRSYAHIAYDNGKITDEEAYEWVRRASELGNDVARKVLAHSREDGKQLPFDVARQRWLNFESEEFKRYLQSPAGQERTRETIRQLLRER